jgi:hypothetical protein
MAFLVAHIIIMGLGRLRLAFKRRNEYLAKRADVNSEREFFLLAVLGADLPGALVEKAGGRPQGGR